MADPNQQGGGGGDQQKQKGGGGQGKQDGVSLSANVNAASMAGGWAGVKKGIGDHSLNAIGFIVCGIAIAVCKPIVYGLLGIKDEVAAPPKPNAWQGAQAIRELKSSNPDQYAKFAQKNADLFEAPTPAPAPIEG